MPTKAEAFKAKAERSSKPNKKRAPATPRRDLRADTSLPGVSATDRKSGGGDTAKRNASKRAAKKGGAALESSTKKATRKSTRKASGGAKRTNNLERRETRRVSAPTARARRSRAKARTTRGS